MSELPFLKVCLRSNGNEVMITADPGGLRLLARRLERLADRVESGKGDHEHVFSSEWLPDGDLAVSNSEDAGESVIHHLRLYGLRANSTQLASGRVV